MVCVPRLLSWHWEREVCCSLSFRVIYWGILFTEWTAYNSCYVRKLFVTERETHLSSIVWFWTYSYLFKQNFPQIHPFSELAQKQTPPTYRSINVPKHPEPGEWHIHMVSYICMCIQGSPVEIRAPPHWKPISHSRTAPPPELSPSSVLPPLSTHCTCIPAGKNSARV